MDLTIVLAAIAVLIALIVIFDNRDQWNPPPKAPSTPKVVNQKRNAPYNSHGRPTVLDPRWATPHVEEEIDEFHDFLKGVRGNVLVRTGKIPITECEGKLLSWSYRPFREGFWKDFVTGGMTDPKTLHWFGTESMVPNPAGNIVESPLTLVTSEEDVLRILGGNANIRIFSSYQPTFPDFNTNEHSDFVTDKLHHKLKGDEFVATDGMIVVIPRGWAYKVQLTKECIGVIRIPVMNPLSWITTTLRSWRTFLSTKQSKTRPITYNYKYGSHSSAEEPYDEGGDDHEPDQ